MPTYTDTTRTSRQDCIFSFTGFAYRIWQPLKVQPPNQYLFETGIDFTIGGHYTNYATIEGIITTNQASPTSTWSWALYARVTCFCGHGTTPVTTDVLIASQTGIANTVDYVDIDEDFDGTYEFTVNSTIKYDVTETATTVLDLPAYTIYKQYERTTAGATATTKVVIKGVTVQDQETVVTPQTTDYKFRVDIDTFFKSGALSGQSQLLVQNMTTNQIAVPDYSHNNTINANFYCLHDGSTVDAKNVGTDDAFGDPADTQLTLDSTVKLETKLKSLGKVNAYNISYPDSLVFRITGFDNTSPSGTTGYRDITRTGSWDETNDWKEYDISSTVGGTTVATGPYNNSGDVFKVKIQSGLTTAGDDGKYDRMYLRGWNFPGANLQLANELEITGGSGNSRTYSGNGKYFNSYRYLELEVKSNTGNVEVDTLTLTCQPNNKTKTWGFQVSSTTYVRVRIDLLMPNNGTLNIDDQDDPYPRKHPTDNTYASQERENKDWFGVTRVSALSIANSNITLNRIYLVADAQSENSDFCFPPEYYVKVQNDSNTGTTYLGRRLWTQDTAGRHEEEFDVLNTSGVKTITTISDFVSRVNSNHPGWTASASTASGSNLRAYANSTNGYSCWLGSITWKADAGGGTVQKDYLNISQNVGEPFCDVLAQTIFDELDTTELIPDYPDPFGVYKQNSPPLITIPAMTILRGQTHGQVVSSGFTGSVNETINLELASTNANRGSGTTNSLGNYNTGSPKSLSNKNHNNKLANSTFTKALNPMYAAKKYRTTFFPGTIGECLSADKSPIYQHAFTHVSGLQLKLYLSALHTPSSFTSITVPISDVSCAAMKYTSVFNQHRILFLIVTKDGDIKRYYTDDDGETTSVAITLGTGSSPAVCCDNSGLEYYFWRTSGGDLYRAVLDSQGNTVFSASAIVSGTCQDKGIGCYERLGKVIVVYSDSATGLKQLSSSNDGETFS